MSRVVGDLLRVLAGRNLYVADVRRLMLRWGRVWRGVRTLSRGLLRRVLRLLRRIGMVLLVLLKHAGAWMLEVRLRRWKALRSGVGMMLEGAAGVSVGGASAQRVCTT